MPPTAPKPSCPPPDPNTRTPVFKAPPKSCDAHCHVFGPKDLFPYHPTSTYEPPDAGKDRLIKPNVEALGLGRDYVREHLKGKCGLSVKRSDKVGDRIFIAGNDAAALGAVYGGATVAAWYPITPSTSVAEAGKPITIRGRGQRWKPSSCTRWIK